MVEVTPRTRAAYGMVLTLRAVARTMAKLPSGSTSAFMMKDGCPRSIDNVTFGVAKTDPWGTPFELRCNPGSNASPEIGSAGPDKHFETLDDVWSDHPLVQPKEACQAACARVTGCTREAGVAEARRVLCSEGCVGLESEIPFFADTCALHDRCADVMPCVHTALAGVIPEASCKDFGQAAAKAVSRPVLAARLSAECDKDLLRVHELLCVSASTVPHELSRCMLTLNRDRVEALIAAPAGP